MARRAVKLAIACALAAAPLVAAAASTGSCTTFDGLSPAPATTAKPVAGYLSTSEAARVCAFAWSCPSYFTGDLVQALSVPIDTLNFSLCMHWMAGPIPTNRIGFSSQQQSLQCIARSKSCAEAAACLPFETFPAGDPRCAVPEAGTDGAGGGEAGADDADAADDGGGVPEAAPPDQRCAEDGGSVYKCDKAYKYALHCYNAYYAPGSHCTLDTDGTRWCAVSDNCMVPLSCIGSLLDYCGGPDGWTHESINCAYNGRSCGVDPDSGLTDCLTGSTLRSCKIQGTECVSSTVEVCDGQYVSEFDCSSIKSTCSKSDGTARCMRNDDACKPSDPGINACTGDSISLCVGGRKATFNCKDAGLTCKPGGGAQSAHCG